MEVQVIVGHRDRVVKEVILVHLDLLELEDLLGLEEMMDPLEFQEHQGPLELLDQLDQQDSLVLLVPLVPKDLLGLGETLDHKD